MLIRADGAGASHGLLDCLTAQGRLRGRRLAYSVGFAVTENVRTAIALLPEAAWPAALDADGAGELAEAEPKALAYGLFHVPRPVAPGWPPPKTATTSDLALGAFLGLLQRASIPDPHPIVRVQSRWCDGPSGYLPLFSASTVIRSRGGA